MSSSAIDPCRKIHVRKLHNFSNHHKCWTVFQIWQIGHGQEVTLVIGLGCGVRQTWIQIPPLPWTSCVIWTSNLPSLGLCSFIQAARWHSLERQSLTLSHQRVTVFTGYGVNTNPGAQKGAAMTTRPPWIILVSGHYGKNKHSAIHPIIFPHVTEEETEVQRG